MPNGRCRMHGGKARKGVEHPNSSHLRYSKYAPDKIVERYKEMVADPQMLTLKEEIALIRARIAELLGNIKEQQSEQTWVELRATLRQVQKARSKKDVPKMATGLTQMEELIEAGFSTVDDWGELGAQMDRLSRLVALERRHIIEMRYLMSAEQVGVLFTQLIQILTMRITDADTRRAVVTDIRGLLAHPGDADPGSGSA